MVLLDAPGTGCSGSSAVAKRGSTKGPLPLAQDRSVPLDSRQTPPVCSPGALVSTGIWPTSVSDEEKVR